MRSFILAFVAIILSPGLAAAQITLPERETLHAEIRLSLDAYETRLIEEETPTEERVELVSTAYANVMTAAALDPEADTADLIRSLFVARYGDPVETPDAFTTNALLETAAGLRAVARHDEADALLHWVYEHLPDDPERRVELLLDLSDVSYRQAPELSLAALVDAANLHLAHIETDDLLRGYTIDAVITRLFILGEWDLARAVLETDDGYRSDEMAFIESGLRAVENPESDLLLPASWLGELFYSPGRAGEAVPVIRGVLALDEDAGEALLVLALIAAQQAFAEAMPVSSSHSAGMLNLGSLAIDQAFDPQEAGLVAIRASFYQELVEYVLASRQRWIAHDHEDGEDRIFLHWNPDNVPYALIRIAALTGSTHDFPWPRYYEYGHPRPEAEQITADANLFLRSVSNAWPYIGEDPASWDSDLAQNERETVMAFIAARYPADRLLPAVRAVQAPVDEEEPDCYRTVAPQPMALWSVIMRDTGNVAAADEALALAIECARFESQPSYRAAALAAIAAAMPYSSSP